MNFVEELKWRGLFHQSTPGLEDALEKGMVVGYIGYDPTAPSLTIGNLVTIMLLKHLQLKGHKPVVLMGGATGRIGDPSGKDKERQLKSFEELDKNLSTQKEQFARFLDFSTDIPNGAIMLNNYDFYKEMNVLDFLRNVGKTLTVNYMMAKESVKKRVETGLSFTEFSYQLLQGYDFQHMYEKHGVSLQMGGSDQWGNIVSGTEMIRKNLGHESNAFALTCPLLTKADGKKFGKSEEGNVWLSSTMTSPYKFYQFWLNMKDADIVNANRIFSLKSCEAIEALEQEHKGQEHLRILQKSLAEELTKWVHPEADMDLIKEVSELLFSKKLKRNYLLNDVSEKFLALVAEEIPSFNVAKSDLEAGINVVELIVNGKIVTSNSDARRAIKGNALGVNKQKVKSHHDVIKTDELLYGKYILIENGKKHKFMLIAE
ncbi:MAG: tyrosine--tRNA ligase [Saprospiraceae bacterium]